MQILVCEDDRIYQKSIKKKIEQWITTTHHEGIRIIIFSSSEDMLAQWEKGLKIDILFLDILFENEMDGMEVARHIRETDEFIPIVFVTNSEAFVKEGYSVHAFRYLSKPICYDDVALCLDVAYKQYTLAHNEYLIIADSGRRLAIRHDEILYLEAQSPYTLIYMQNISKPHKIRYRFQDLLLKLPCELFSPCHRSYIVNMIHVRCIKRTELILSNGHVLPVSRPYAKALDAAFDSYYQEGGVITHVDTL